MEKQIPLDKDDEVPFEVADDGTKQVFPDVAYKRLAIVNVAFVGFPDAGDRGWVLIDAGIIGTTGMIRKAAKERFGDGSRPAAIIMTHGHFDHIGGLKTLSEEWDAPIYAHPLELPYLNGQESYPPPDPLVGGLMALSSPLYPRGPIDVSERLHALPTDGSVPFLPEWRWVATPGHSPGHISLWRERDRLLLSGDAVITTQQESVYAVAVQAPELHGPPTYFTPDWTSARNSVMEINRLAPDAIVPGHGVPMQGPAMKSGLQTLAENFDSIAVPHHGRYASQHQSKA